MCGRFALVADSKSLKQRFHLRSVEGTIFPRYNIAPGSLVPIILSSDTNTAIQAKWGLIPSWAKDPKIGYKMINARSEDVMERPSYRRPFLSQRCLVPVNGFYEWDKVGGSHKPYFFSLKETSLFSLAGLYDIWRDAEDKAFPSFTILTTQPNDLVARIHNRMPVILKREDEIKWIDETQRDPDALHRFLTPFPSLDMSVQPVSTLTDDDHRDIRKTDI